MRPHTLKHHSLRIHKCILYWLPLYIILHVYSVFMHEHDVWIMHNLLGRGTKLNHELVSCLCPVGRRLHIRPNARKEGRSGRKADARTEIPGPWHKQRVISNIMCILSHFGVHTHSYPQLKSLIFLSFWRSSLAICTVWKQMIAGNRFILVIRILVYSTVHIPALQGF